ncbi:MAG TPA: ABC transporter substrate-binding protein [Chloroflexota bacterium]
MPCRRLLLIVSALALGLGACAPAAPTSAPAAPPPAALAQAAPPATPAREAAAPAPTAAAAPPVRYPVVASYVPSLSFMPLFLAAEKGYLAAEGVDLDLQVGRTASDDVAFLGNGQLDAAFGNFGDALLNGIRRGLDIRVVASQSYNPDSAQQSPSGLFVAKPLANSGTVKAPADLRGRRVALNTPGGIVEYQIAKAIERGGLTPQDVDLVAIPFPDMPLALKNGAVDAALMPEPWSTVTREQEDGVMLVPNPDPGLLVTVLLYGTGLLKPEREPAAQAFLRGLRRAANELLDPAVVNTDENVAIWVKYTKVQEELVRKAALYHFERDLAVDVGSLLDQQRFLLQRGRLEYDQPLPESQLIDSRFVVRK